MKNGTIRTVLSYLLIIGLALYAISLLSSNITQEMSYTELMQKIENKSVESIELKNDRLTAEVKLKDEDNVLREVKIPSSTTFIETIQPKVISGEFELNVANETAMEVIAPLIPNIILLLGTLFIFIYMIKKTKEIIRL